MAQALILGSLAVFVAVQVAILLVMQSRDDSWKARQ